MKQLSLLLLIVLISICCSENFSSPETGLENMKIKDSLFTTNPLTDPDVFIGKYKAKAMILGVFHFGNPGLDSYKEKFEFNILEDEHQAELNILLHKLAAFKPTKILCECNRIKSDSTLNEEYKKYLSGEFTLENRPNEIFQIGFNLAKELGHTQLYCTDAQHKWCGVELDWDNYDMEAYLKSKGQLEKSSRYDYNALYELEDSLKTVQSLSEHFITTNDPRMTLKSYQAYLTTYALEGAGDHYVGADSYAKQSQRNMKIFSNALDLTNFDTQERLLLIYGNSHVFPLKQFFTHSPDYDYVEVNDYLSK